MKLSLQLTGQTKKELKSSHKKKKKPSISYGERKISQEKEGGEARGRRNSLRSAPLRSPPSPAVATLESNSSINTPPAPTQSPPHPIDSHRLPLPHRSPRLAQLPLPPACSSLLAAASGGSHGGRACEPAQHPDGQHVRHGEALYSAAHVCSYSGAI